MTSLRGFRRDIGSFAVAYFTHHHHIRVLPQQGAKRLCKTQPRFFVHIDLVDAGQHNLAGVFYCRDIDLG